VHRLADPLTFRRTGVRLAASSVSTHRVGCAFVLRSTQPPACLAEGCDRTNETEH